MTSGCIMFYHLDIYPSHSSSRYMFNNSSYCEYLIIYYYVISQMKQSCLNFSLSSHIILTLMQYYCTYRLIYAGKQLADNKTANFVSNILEVNYLSCCYFYLIEGGSVLNLVLALRGGHQMQYHIHKKSWVEQLGLCHFLPTIVLDLKPFT